MPDPSHDSPGPSHGILGHHIPDPSHGIGPLHGIKVIEVGQALAGPYAGVDGSA